MPLKYTTEATPSFITTAFFVLAAKRRIEFGSASFAGSQVWFLSWASQEVPEALSSESYSSILLSTQNHLTTRLEHGAYRSTNGYRAQGDQLALMTSQSIAAEINIRCFWVLGDRLADVELQGAGRPTSRTMSSQRDTGAI